MSYPKDKTKYGLTFSTEGTTMELIEEMHFMIDLLVHADHTRDQRKIRKNNMTYEFKKLGGPDPDPEGLKLDRYV